MCVLLALRVCVSPCLFVCVRHSVSAIFMGKAAFFSPPPRTHTLVHTHAACSVTRRKETQGEAAHLTGIQLSVSNGGHPGEEEEGEADLQ